MDASGRVGRSLADDLKAVARGPRSLGDAERALALTRRVVAALGASLSQPKCAFLSTGARARRLAR
eukprot:4273958-Alexandrium_andersonii.AAC.1